MTAAYNPAEVERMIAEAREDDQRMPQAPWAHAPVEPPAGSCDIRGPECDCRETEPAVWCWMHDGIAEWVPVAVADAIIRQRNNLAAMADQLAAASAEINRLSALVSVSPDDLRDVLAENTRVEADNERLRLAFDEAIRSLDTGGTIRSAFCAWCNQRWPQLDGEMYEVTRKYAVDHAETCPANAMRIERDKLRASTAALVSRLETARGEIDSAHKALSLTGVPLDLPLTERIEWLARQRPIWDDVDRLRRERDEARAEVRKLAQPPDQRLQSDPVAPR